jgi:quercetin dioxygenase-like cupin family protein
MKGHTLIFSILAIALLASGCAEWNAPEPKAPPTPKDTGIDVTAEPSHRLAVENQYLRALKVELPPDRATLKHRHDHDYVTVTFGAAEISNEVDGKEPVKIALEHGQVRFAEGSGPPHIVRNLALTTFRNVTIELLQEGTKPGVSSWEDDHGLFSFQGGTREILFAKGDARVSKIELRPGGMLPKHQLADHCFFVAVSDLDLREERSAHSLQLPSGGVKWDDGGSLLKLTNKAKEPAKIVLVEFK